MTIPSPPLKQLSANPSPKWRFLQSKEFVEKHRELVDSDEFQRAVDYGLAQYLRGLVDTAPNDISSSTYMASSASLFQRVVGAHEFLSVVRNLSEVPPPPSQKVSDNLS